VLNIITLLCLDTGKHPVFSAKGNPLQTIGKVDSCLNYRW